MPSIDRDRSRRDRDRDRSRRDRDRDRSRRDRDRGRRRRDDVDRRRRGESTWFRGTMQGSHREGGHLIGVWTNPKCQWLLNLESRTSHLPFRRGRGENRARAGLEGEYLIDLEREWLSGQKHLSSSTLLALTAETAADTEFQVDHWELVPAMLAADECFEWSTNIPHANYCRDSHYCCDCRCDSHHGGAAMRALQKPVSPTTELLNDVGAL